MNTADAFDNTLEESGHQVLNLVDLANLKYLLQLCQEKSFLDTVGEGPVSQEAFQESNCEASIFGEEQHGASEQLLIERRASLHLMQRDNHILEEYHMLVTEGYGKTTDNGCQDVKELSSTIEFVSFVNQLIERFIDGLADHLATGY